jgi:hypothetical protein
MHSLHALDYPVSALLSQSGAAHIEARGIVSLPPQVARNHAKALRRLATALDDHAAALIGGEPE